MDVVCPGYNIGSAKMAKRQMNLNANDGESFKNEHPLKRQIIKV